MKIKGLKKCGNVPEVVITKAGKRMETGEMIPQFVAPDGFKGTYRKFVSEVERGRLHGCIVSAS
jgi:Na+-translocating ferredoxin:NAD+ oxidoreductase RnfG subunit